jgi:hypothetical protein
MTSKEGKLHSSCCPVSNQDRFSLSIVLEVAEILEVMGVKVLYDVRVYPIVYRFNRKV